MQRASRVPPTLPRPGRGAAAISRGERPRIVPWSLWAVLFLAPPALAQCPAAPPLAHYTGASNAVCPCFIPNEQAAVVFTAPPADYPLEVLRVGIAWASQFGGAPQSLEEAIHVYAGGLPDPGTPIFTLPGPVLTDGFVNQFDLEPQPGEITVASGPFTVALEFLNQNANNIFAPSVVHDANGCQAGKNAVFAQPGGWADACALGVSGDWVFFAVYRPCVPAVGIGGDPRIVMSEPLLLMPPVPNPARGPVEFEFAVARAGDAALTVYDVSGRRVAVPAAGSFAAGIHRATWDGRALHGARVAAGVYFAELRAGEHRVRRTLRIAE